MFEIMGIAGGAVESVRCIGLVSCLRRSDVDCLSGDAAEERRMVLIIVLLMFGASCVFAKYEAFCRC